MADIFSAAASAAGLVSLSMQLLESTQKLKGFYTASRDAPETVSRLCFDLETMALALRQFEQYRQSDLSGGELLGRCIVACEQAVTKIKTAVDKVDRLLHKTRFAGGLYMGFKEPEVKALLQDMEHAKSSMLLAYTSYCQSWNMRESAKHAAALTLQSERTEKILDLVTTAPTVMSGSIASAGSLSPAAREMTHQESTPAHNGGDPAVRHKHTRPRLYRLRVGLPRWLSECVWEFGIAGSNGVWTAQVNSTNVRPYDDPVFDKVRAGDIHACRDLIRSGQLSPRDYIDRGRDHPHSLLQEAADEGRIELCKFLLQTSSYFHRDDILESAFRLFIVDAKYQDFEDCEGSWEKRQQHIDAVFEVFVEDCAMHIDLEPDAYTPDRNCLYTGEEALLVSTNVCRTLLDKQESTFASLPFIKQFSMVIDSTGWPATMLSSLMTQNPYDCVSASNGDGKTAFHWAAMHFGEWLLRHNYPMGKVASHSLENAESYSKLASDLICRGANVHARWRNPGLSFPGLPFPHDSRNRFISPFGAFIRGLADRQSNIARRDWNAADLADAVERWGNMIVKGGLSLDQYIARENCALGQMHHNLSWKRKVTLSPARLFISDRGTLAVRVARIIRLPIYKAKAVTLPGAWPVGPIGLDTIIWAPWQCDRHDGVRWSLTDYLHITSSPFPVDKTDHHNHHDGDDWHEPISFCGTQDDHGLAARLLTKFFSDEPQRLRGVHHRRSASCPPVEELRGAREFPRSSNKPLGIFHKCPLDSRWRVSPGHRRYITGRRCMLGHCQVFPREQVASSFYRHLSGWERWLLRSGEHLEKAQRFAARFRPEAMFDVEETAREAERARMAMEPPETQPDFRYHRSDKRSRFAARTLTLKKAAYGSLHEYWVHR